MSTIELYMMKIRQYSNFTVITTLLFHNSICPIEYDKAEERYKGYNK